MIAVGAIIYLNCPNRTVGAFLFSIGLITILELKFILYTGVVGFARKLQEIPILLLILIMNAIGCLFIMLFPAQDVAELWRYKLEVPLNLAFAEAIICGILIWVCVYQHKTQSTAVISILTTLISIPAFILCGAEHSVADICFMFASRDFTLKGVVFILVVASGNAVGSLIPSVWVSKRNELHQDNKNRYR